MASNYVQRAQALVGTRFRAQGRGEEGLDCIGVLLLTFGIDAHEAPRNYRLRGDHRSDVEQGLLKHFRRVAARELRPGDVMLMSVANDQLHLGVRTDCGFVHAHAGIGSVVETPGMPDWRMLSIYRKRARKQAG